jgi:PadR family transcriptional regulator PadR
VRGFFIQPRLLLLLARKATHGYELMDALRSVPGDENLADPGMLYRTLRQFEQGGLVISSWDTGGHGPARRVYQITDAGHEYLEWWATDIRKTRAQPDQFLTEYESVVGPPSPSLSKKRRHSLCAVIEAPDITMAREWGQLASTACCTSSVMCTRPRRWRVLKVR